MNILIIEPLKLSKRKHHSKVTRQSKKAKTNKQHENVSVKEGEEDKQEKEEESIVEEKTELEETKNNNTVKEIILPENGELIVVLAAGLQDLLGPELFAFFITTPEKCINNIKSKE